MMQRRLVLLVLLLSLSSRFWGQQANEPPAPQAGAPAPAPQSAAEEVKETTVLGCLRNDNGEFFLTDAAGTRYPLPGDRGLDPYVGHEVSVGGTTRVDGSDPTITVTEIKDIVNPSAPIPGFTASEWRAAKSRAYGLSLQYPASFALLPEGELRKEWNFANPNGAQSLVSIEIPNSAYAGSNFRGGYFTATANPTIANAAACEQFGYAEPQAVSSKTLEGVKYSLTNEGEGAAGTAYQYFYLHTYQHNVCYEFKLEVAAVNTDAFDLPCSIPLISEQNKTDLLDAFLSRMVFERPSPPLPAHRMVRPEVTGFTSASKAAEHAREITVSWTTQGVDYVHLEFACTSSLVVTGSSADLGCGSSGNRNFPPSGSATFLVYHLKGKALIPFQVNLQPFAHGAAIPRLNRNLSVPVSTDTP